MNVYKISCEIKSEIMTSNGSIYHYLNNIDPCFFIYLRICLFLRNNVSNEGFTCFLCYYKWKSDS
jgi:hypothetical protein